MTNFVLPSSQLFEFENCASTQDLARDWIKAHPGESAWFRADLQTSGRGRENRPWESEHGNLFASYAFAFPLEMSELSFLPLIAGFSFYLVTQTLLQKPAALSLKWPNDLVWVDEKQQFQKLGGVLVESFGQKLCVLGFGLNIAHSPAGMPATSLRALGPKDGDQHPRKVLNDLRKIFEQELNLFFEKPAQYKGQLIFFLENVAMHPLWQRRYQDKDGKVWVAQGLRPDGALRAASEERGGEACFVSGELRFL